MNRSERISKSMRNLQNFVGINIGLFLFAFGVVVFRNPNNFASGGMAGLSLLTHSFLPNVPIGAIMMVFNMTALGLGYLVLGKKSGMGSVYGTFALAAIVWFLEVRFPLSAPLTDQRFMELIYSVFIPGFGAALVFHCGATTGGTDIIAQMASKIFKLKVTTALLIIDFTIALGAGFIFSLEDFLYSVLGVCIRIFMMDMVLEGLRVHKILVIISDKSEEIQQYINYKIKRGATVHVASGSFTRKNREVITTVLSRRQALILQQHIKSVDPEAFITITNSTEIVGSGFGKFG